MKSHAAWLAERVPTPHERLVERVVALLEANPEWRSLPVSTALLLAADALLANVMSEREGEPRGAALDLLAADACVTWAFEAAADDPSTLGARAADAMRRFTEAAA